MTLCHCVNVQKTEMLTLAIYTVYLVRDEYYLLVLEDFCFCTFNLQFKIAFFELYIINIFFLINDFG